MRPKSYLAERGVLSVDELESVLGLPGVDVFRAVEDPKPIGVGLKPRDADLMLDVRRTPLPLRPSSSSSRDMLEPW